MFLFGFDIEFESPTLSSDKYGIKAHWLKLKANMALASSEKWNAIKMFLGTKVI